jgi:hypothetical protein
MAKSKPTSLALLRIRLKFSPDEVAMLERLEAMRKKNPVPKLKFVQESLFADLPQMMSRREWLGQLETEHRRRRENHGDGPARN